MLGRKVQDMLLGRVAEERPPLGAAMQGLGEKGDRTPLGHETTDLEAPVGIEIIHHPIVALHRGQLADDVGQMCGPICPGTGLPRFHTSCPVGTPKEASKARTPWRIYSCSRFAGLPGCTGWVG
jgi:hypothetical protein